MAQLQAVMLKQMTAEQSRDKDGEASPESVKPGTATLPTLVPVKPETSSVDIMDWLEMLAVPMSDLSDGSAVWWYRVKQEAAKSYAELSSSSPLERLKVVPPTLEPLESGKWSRVNSRGEHDNDSEMVARRLTGSTVSLLFRLMTLYQPGGEEEKVRILKNLQEPPQEQDPQKVLEALRNWDRWLRRCRELAVAAPDPALLTRGLNSMVKALLDRNPEALFRSNLVKSTLMVDTRPTAESVDSYYKHLLAECEALAVTSAALAIPTTPTTSRPEAKVKPMRTDKGNQPNPPVPPPPPTPTRSSSQSTTRSDMDAGDKSLEDKSKVPCKFFGRTYKGCARGSRCPFQHSWEGLDKNGRCLGCGGKNHAVKDCPYKKPPAGDSPTATTPTRPPTNKAPPQQPPASSTSNKNVRIDENPQVEPIPARTSSSTTSGDGEQMPDLKEVLADVGKMLKAMTSTATAKMLVIHEDKTVITPEPMKKVVEESYGSDLRGLLDSGASHALVPASQEEYQNGSPVKVTLAVEDTKVLRQNQCGTVLVPEEGPGRVQPIVPLGAVIEDLGYTLTWRPGHLRLHHPTRGTVKVNVTNRCPEVSSRDARKLIREIEEKQLTTLKDNVDTLTARLEMLRSEEKRDWVQIFKDYSTNGEKTELLKAVQICPFTKDLPFEVHSLLAEGFELQDGLKYMKGLPLTRRKRKLMMASNRWVVNMFPGKDAETINPLDVVSKAGKVMITVDVLNSKLWNIHAPMGVYRLLLWAAVTGRITDIVANPPHQTWPTSAMPRRGEESYPKRSKDHPYGLPQLPEHQQQQLDLETAAIVKPMLLWILATMSNRGVVGFLLTTPADEERHRECDPQHATFWHTEAWKSFKSIAGMSKASFYMGAYGHRAKCPTTIATNYPSLAQLEGVYDFNDGCVPPSLLDKKEMRSWSFGFKAMVLEAITDMHECATLSDEDLESMGLKVSKMTKQQRQEWKQHLADDHQPYRSDCSVCINAQATGYHHRRREHPKMFALALDLAGPFRQRGRDLDHEDYRYIMVAAYRCPKSYMSAKAIPECDQDFYVPDEPEGDVDDPMALEDEPVSDGEGTPDAGDESGEDSKFEEEVDKLAAPEEHSTIYITRSLRRRTGPHALQAAKEILLQLRQCGLHVEAIHTDRAREFKTAAFRTWTADEKLRHTRTAEADPAANSTAEVGVKWAKGRVRALIKRAGAGAQDWPMAISHASASLWAKAKAFPSSPWTRQPACPFGSEVWFRAKAYKGKEEKKHEAAGDRWKRGWYRGPAMDVSRGHLILREDGGLTIAKSVKFNVINPKDELPDLLSPAEADGLREGDDVCGSPQTRSELKREIEFLARKKLEEGATTTQDVLQIYERLEELGDTDLRLGKKTSTTSWFTGAFVHGGLAGTRMNLRSYPFTTKFLVEFGKKFAEGVPFSALGIARNADLGLHRDIHNSKSSVNMVVPLSEFSGGGIWVQGDELEQDGMVAKSLPNGQEVSGKVYDLKFEEKFEFDPRKWHQVQEWQGDRVVMLMYTPRATKLVESDVQDLKDHGFPMDEVIKGDSDEEEDNNESSTDPPFDVNIKMMNAVEHEQIAFIEVDEHSSFATTMSKTGGCAPTTVSPTMTRTLKKAEVQYTHGIEEILSSLKKDGKPLEVTHTVSLSDVRKNLKAWAPSASKEYVNLKDSKKAFEVRKRSGLPDDCLLLPCKGVFTIKPDKSPAGYRRKTRFVACGNHAPGDGDHSELYAAGLDATSFRIMLSYSSRKKKWKIGTTDIRQAFVLAPWRGRSVALIPPQIAFDLQLAEPGDVWYVLQALYGLRESPALWAAYRDQQLRAARWFVDIDGVATEVKLQQLVSDDQIWKIVRTNGNTEALGYVMVYIDDLMIMAEEGVMHSMFKWVSDQWECDDLDVLEYDHPIRFLGMELHKTVDGVELSQEGFIRELLRAHGHTGSSSRSQGSRETLLLTVEEEEALLSSEKMDLSGQEQQVKEAQRWVGEMLWLCGRTRPDIQYVTSIMSSRLTRCPDLVNKIGMRLLDYLAETIGYRLGFFDDGVEPELRAYTDSSFSPSSGRSHGSVGIFYGSSAISWRSSRQQLVTLSTAESELLEGIDGCQLAMSTIGLIQEVSGYDKGIYLHLDNQAAISLLTGSTGSWRTRHLRLRSAWIKEKVNAHEVHVRHEPGLSQRADIGTKPLPKERLKQLALLWNLNDRKKDEKSIKTANAQEPSWCTRLLLLCQICGAAAEKEGIKTEVPWDLYLAVIVLSIAVIGLWEGFKQCMRGREARLKALRTKANKMIAKKKLTKTELKELQRMLALKPEQLTSDQKVRLLELRERFEETMPPGTSPTPTLPTTATASSSTMPSEPRTRDQAVQATPAFERVHSEPPARMVTFEGPFINCIKEEYEIPCDGYVC
ncbi:RE1 [Symbiodinium sp. CCMP2592]|nr:RE1 [Symbiodinium sp. CCMP2592]